MDDRPQQIAELAAGYIWDTFNLKDLEAFADQLEHLHAECRYELAALFAGGERHE